MKSTQVQPASFVQASPAESLPSPSTTTSFRRRASSISAVPASLAVHGNYSIERLLELEHYTQTKSYWHVVWLMIWIPFLPVCVLFIFQLPRLAPPEAGVRANWVYFVERGGGGALMGSECVLRMMCTLMPELIPVLPIRTRLFLNIFGGAAYTVVSLLYALVVGFPVPFTASLVNPAVLCIAGFSVYLVIRPVMATTPSIKKCFKTYFSYINVVAFISISYPAYMALFHAVGDHYPRFQPLVTLVAPLMKVGLWKVLAQSVQDWEDLTPVVVVFSIDFFSSLYQAVSVQASSSLLTTAAIITVDFLAAARSQWKLYHCTNTLRDLLQDTGAQSLLSTVISICDEPGSFQATSDADRAQLRAVRVYSTAPSYRTSTEAQRMLEKIVAANILTSTKPQMVPSQSTNRQRAAALFSRILTLGLFNKRVEPERGEPLSYDQTRRASASVIAQGKQSIAVFEATAMFFRTEMLLLTEYLECFVSLFFSINMVFVWASPNAEYYPSMNGTRTSEELIAVLLNILVLFALEVLSFVMLNIMLWKRLRFSPLHQLGFVMDRQATVIRVTMLFIFLLTVHFDLVHSGPDFSFQFKWLRTRNSDT